MRRGMKQVECWLDEKWTRDKSTRPYNRQSGPSQRIRPGQIDQVCGYQRHQKHKLASQASSET